MTIHRLIALLLLIGGAIAPQGMVWAQLKPKFHTNAPVGHPVHSAMLKYLETVRLSTGGRVDFALFPAMQLGGEAEVAEKIKLGAIEAGNITSSVFSAWVPDVEVIDLPFIFRDDDHVLASYAILRRELAPKFERQGFHLLGFGLAGARHLISTFPIRQPDDVKGKKMRVIQNPIHIDTWRALGANPTPLPAPQIYNALQTGVIDYFDFAKSFYFSFRFYEVGKHFTELGHIYALYGWVVSNAYWNRLDPAHQRAIEQASVELFSTVHRTTLALDDEGLKKALDAGTGVQVIRITDKTPWRQKMEPVWTKFTGTSAERQKLVATVTAAK